MAQDDRLAATEQDTEDAIIHDMVVDNADAAQPTEDSSDDESDDTAPTLPPATAQSALTGLTEVDRESLKFPV